MKSIRQLAIWILLLLPLAPTVAIAAQQSSRNPASKSPSSPSQETSKADEIARGRYLVVEVARCGDCHTPHNPNGTLDRSKWLQGGPVWIMPVQSKQLWAEHAPALAGFPYTDKQAEDILEKGIGTNGNPIQQPMHAYHLHPADAQAIIAYLRSLPAAP